VGEDGLRAENKRKGKKRREKGKKTTKWGKERELKKGYSQKQVNPKALRAWCEHHHKEKGSKGESSSQNAEGS